MNTPAHPEQIHLPTFFAPEAFDRVREQGSDIVYDVAQLRGISDLATEMFDKSTLPERIEDLNVILQFSVPGFKPPTPDISFHKAGPDTPYIPVSELAKPLNTLPETIPKKDIIDSLRPTLQIQLGTELSVDRNLTYWLANSLVYPPAEDHKMVASKSAWWHQFTQEALHPFKNSVSKRNEFKQRVAATFAGAIVLKPRQD